MLRPQIIHTLKIVICLLGHLEEHFHLYKMNDSASFLRVKWKLIMSAHCRIRICISRIERDITEKTKHPLSLDPKPGKLLALQLLAFCFAHGTRNACECPLLKLRVLRMGNCFSKQRPVLFIYSIVTDFYWDIVLGRHCVCFVFSW